MTTMKTIYNRIVRAAMVAAIAGSMASCMSEAPFSNEEEAIVKLNVMVNTTLTRAEESKIPSNNQELLDNCVIYISNKDGLLHKWKGVSNIPSELSMRYGNYVAEAWAGDSVPVAYESVGKKFYRCYEPFSVNSATAQVNVRCGLANVVTSVDESTIDSEQVKDVKVTFSSAKGSLSFSSENWSDKAYFMMTTGDKNSDGVNFLNYVVEGKDTKGNAFTKEGVISDVKSAHEYRLKFEYHPSEPTDGGAFIKIMIDDTVVEMNEDITILGRPAFAWDQSDLEVGEQIIGEKGAFVTHSLRIAAYNGFESITITPVINEMFNGFLPTLDGESSGSHSFDLIKMDETYKQKLSDYGISIEIFNDETNKNDLEGVSLHKYVIIFSAEWLNNLPENNEAYELTVLATDVNGKSSETVVSIANTTKAIAKSAPVNVDAAAFAADLTNIGAKSVTLPLTFNDDDDLTNAAVQYRAVGTESWNTQPINLSRAVINISVTITGLNPSTEYEYRTVAGEIVDGEYELKSKIAKFTTESTFTLPGASFEDWSTYSAKTMLGTKTVTLPTSTGDKATSFWGSGNEGSATANMTLTDKSTDMKHTGQYSARLESKSALGVIAAGNMFVGEYVKTDGTNGVLSVGREYDGSHPSAVSVWANYRPAGSVTVKSGNEEFLPDGLGKDGDHGQIYVALTTSAIELRTNPKDRKLFNPEDPEVVAYGQVTWTGNFGADGSLENVKIPFVYNERAKTNKPTHIVIVASASKYGDYFTGAPGSVLYLDDFELVYE